MIMDFLFSETLNLLNRPLRDVELVERSLNMIYYTCVCKLESDRPLMNSWTQMKTQVTPNITLTTSHSRNKHEIAKEH